LADDKFRLDFANISDKGYVIAALTTLPSFSLSRLIGWLRRKGLGMGIGAWEWDLGEVSLQKHRNLTLFTCDHQNRLERNGLCPVACLNFPPLIVL